MLDHILQQVQSFERTHGMRPNAVLISSEHMEALQRYYPGLFEKDPTLELGFRFIVVPSGEATHPRAVLIPDRRHHRVRGMKGAA